MPEPRADRALWWRVPVFGLLGAVLGCVLFLTLMGSGSTIAQRIAQAPGWLCMPLTYQLEWPSLQRTNVVLAEDMDAMLIVNLVVWSLLGLAPGVLLAVRRRPRRLPQSEGTR